MAKTEEKVAKEQQEETAAQQAPQGQSPEQAAQAAQQQMARAQIQVDDRDAIACYANFCRVTGTPEELIIDFGLNPQPMGPPREPIQVKQRVVMNFYTAKRLLAALSMSVQRHEQIFGVLETDINKRVRPQVASTT